MKERDRGIDKERIPIEATADDRIGRLVEAEAGEDR